MFILVIHIGAGCHSSHLDARYRKLLKTALSKDLREASTLIERNPLTNTGYGSSLDSEGHASCDCSIASVSSGKVVNMLTLTNITDCRNPTVACQQVLALLEAEYQGLKGQMGLLRPSTLDFGAAREKYSEIPSESILLNNARVLYARFMEHEAALRSLVEKEQESREDQHKETLESKRPCREDKERKNTADGAFEHALSPRLAPDVQDTVGLIQLDTTVHIATSSGGNFLHPPGRVSCAGVFGAGLGYGRGETVEVFCLCSGNGDDIVKMGLAAHVADSMAQKLLEAGEWPDLGTLLVETVERRSSMFQMAAVDSNLNHIVYVGVLAVVRNGRKVRLVFCHSTESFYFGFRTQSGIETVLNRHDGSVGTFVCGEYKL